MYIFLLSLFLFLPLSLLSFSLPPSLPLTLSYSWLSDVSFSHPAVWSMALQYSHSTQLHKVTHEGKFLLLITHNHDYQLWQCTVEPLKWVWHLSGVEPINVRIN